MAHLTLAQLQEQITKLEAELKKLAAHQEWMKRAFRPHGISGPWVSPQQAADLLCISREGVMWHVRRAERFREADVECECKYETHYRRVPRKQDKTSDRQNWQIHFIEFEKLLAIPQDNLKAG